ncbi:MAG: hypothetical protein IJ088_01910 [Clostridia bacterium]|nr:hypothetical protein [Clostridia bacterium]
MEEAILLVLHELNGRLTGTKPDTAKFETPANTRLRHVLLSAFDPETSEEIRDGLKEHHVDLEDPFWAKAYYGEYIICLLRILESVQNLTKQMGSNGYFTFLESFMGDKVEDNLSLNRTVAIPVFD